MNFFVALFLSIKAKRPIANIKFFWKTKLIDFLNKLKFFWHSVSRDGNFAPYFDNDLCSLPNRNSLTLSVQDVQLKMFLHSADYFFRIVLSVFKYRYIPHSKEIKLLLNTIPSSKDWLETNVPL